MTGRPLRLVLALDLAHGVALGVVALGVVALAAPAAASEQDATLCLATAERVDAGETLTEAEKTEAHEACVSALSATASITQKYQFQEADFAITGARDTF